LTAFTFTWRALPMGFMGALTADIRCRAPQEPER
jgi:hypothetical protein